VTFYVQKHLPLGSIRFGVNARRHLSAIDDDPSLSTGPAGELLFRDSAGSYFADNVRTTGPQLPVATKEANAAPFLDALKPDGTSRSWAFLALAAAGLLFILLGVAVLVRKGPAGWVEILLGLAMIATPVVLTAGRLRLLRRAEERRRAERAAIDAANRRMLTDYVAALERVSVERSDDAFASLEREGKGLTLPYEVWSATARQTALRTGFAELAKRGVTGAVEVGRILDRLSCAAGLTEEDARDVKRGIYETVVWHLLAGDRLGRTQEGFLTALHQALAIAGDEHAALDQFRRLRTLGPEGLPRINCTLRLDLLESCVHETTTPDGSLVITTRRVALGTRKPVEVELAQIDDITVDADSALLMIRADGRRKPLIARAGDAIYAAAIIDLACALDARDWFA
jgi:hypothetical protein